MALETRRSCPNAQQPGEILTSEASCLMWFLSKVKPSLRFCQEIEPEPNLLMKVENAFSEMDRAFAEALEKYDNVFLDVQLVEHPRPDLPKAYLSRILFNEQILKEYSTPPEEQPKPAGISFPGTCFERIHLQCPSGHRQCSGR
jgi:hypothetical protein